MFSHILLFTLGLCIQSTTPGAQLIYGCLLGRSLGTQEPLPHHVPTGARGGERAPSAVSGLQAPRRLSCVQKHCLFSCVRLSATLWTVACQDPLSIGFPRQTQSCIVTIGQLALSRMFYKWSHTGCGLCLLAPFTQHHELEIPACCCSIGSSFLLTVTESCSVVGMPRTCGATL